MLDTAPDASQESPGNDELERLRMDRARLRAANARLRLTNSELRMENARLHERCRDLQTVVDSHVERAQKSGLFGPLEMSAGTCVGPRRQRSS